MTAGCARVNGFSLRLAEGVEFRLGAQVNIVSYQRHGGVNFLSEVGLMQNFGFVAAGFNDGDFAILAGQEDAAIGSDRRPSASCQWRSAPARD